MTDPRVTEAVVGGGVRELDARGLMPLAEARAVMRACGAFVKGEGDLVDGKMVLASDQIWAALLSLEDAAEAVAAATRLDWQFHPRGFDNVDLHLRYGDAIVPWLATRVDAAGVLRNVPWCVLPCLLACDGADAFALAWRVTGVDGGALDVARAWLDRHPATGAACLAALGADRRAAAHRRGLELRGLVAAPPPPATVDAVLATLDACAARLAAGRAIPWPSTTGAGPDRVRELRAVAARDGDDWGLAIERAEGDRPTGVYAARTAVYAYGSRLPRGWALTARPGLELGPPELALPALHLPAGRIVAVVPHLAHVDAWPSESGVYRALAAALAA